MKINDAHWLPKEGGLPKKFVTGLLVYLTSEEKEELAETHVEWAKRIIRSDSGLAVAHVKSENILDWVEVELSRWEKLANTLEDVPDRQWNDLIDLAWLCHSLLRHQLPCDDGVWIVIDQEGQLQALVTVKSEDGAWPQIAV